MKKFLNRILLIDDNEDHAELVLRCFEENGVRDKVYHINDGEVALEYIMGKSSLVSRTENLAPQLILLDLRLPKVDGHQILESIKKDDNLKRIPVVILSSSDSTEDLDKAYNQHANSYIVKPQDFEGYTQMVNELFSYWMNINAV